MVPPRLTILHGRRRRGGEIKQAARWHARVSGFKDIVARVLAYKHAGFTDDFTARHLDTTPNTVEKRLDRVIAVYGPEAAMVQPEGPVYREDFDPVTPEEVADWPEHYQHWWIDAGKEHPTKVPRELQDRFEANRR